MFLYANTPIHAICILLSFSSTLVEAVELNNYYAKNGFHAAVPLWSEVTKIELCTTFTAGGWANLAPGSSYFIRHLSQNVFVT